MHRALLRQLKRVAGVGDEAALADFLAEVAGAADAPGLSPRVAALLGGFGELLTRIGNTYDQYDRDLALRTRSMDLSSQELSVANERLRVELASRDRALKSLRETASGLLAGSGGAAALAGNDLESLSLLMAQLIEQREHERRELDNQKFALDQHAIVSITDTAGDILYANERFCEISGYTQAELIGQSHRIVKSAVHPPQLFAEMWETISAGRVWHGEICNRRKDGGHYWVAATIVPFLDAHGLPLRYIGIRTDITARKAMEAQLQEQLRLVEELIEAIPLPLYLKDTAGRYLRLNRAFEEFLGIRREELLGRTVEALLGPEDAELLAAGGSQSYEAEVPSRDGLVHQCIYRKAVLTRPDGSISGLVGTIIDITERKEAERTLRRAMEAAEAANRAKSDFLANMSHEIRTPMNGVIGMTDLTLSTELDDEQREYLQAVKSSADALLTIIDDILDFSKIEAGMLLIENVSFPLPRLVSEAAKTVALRAHDKGLELVVDVDPALPQFVIGDPGRLRQVLINLLSNAVKFTERGEIVVRVGAAGGGIVFAVSDTGIGIAAEKQANIFDAFVQADTSTTRRFGGTGLGLTISARLVAMMGGRLSVTSTPGSGSTFQFELPLAPDAERPAMAEAPVDLRGLQALVVDDNSTNRIVLSRILMSWGMQVTAVDSGPAALQWLAGAPAVDLVMLDAHMPDMDGFEVARRIRADAALARCPLLMLSSGATRGDGERCRQVGIAAYFSKPVAHQELLAGIYSVLGIGEVRGGAADLVTRHSLRETREELSVLLVEDHPVNQKLALSLLEKWGHRVVVAQNGQEALECAAEHAFDVILMDLQMPVMGGLEATQRLRLEGCTTRIVAMTANAMEGDRELCLAAGMDDYIAKPIKAADLFARLHRAPAKPEESKPMSRSAYDYAAALQQVDPEIVELVSGMFLDSYGADLDALRAGVAAGDAAAIRRAAHTLRGVVGNFGAEPAVRLAKRIEDDAHRGDAEAAATHLAAFETELESLVSLLRRLQPGA